MAATDNPITIENQQAGSPNWQLGPLVADDMSQQIKGYASLTSVLQGGSLTLYVTVNPAQAYSIDFYRIGWYGGLGGRLELHAGPLTGVSQPACLPDATTGLIACNWAPSYTMTIPVSWNSGVYMAVLTNAAGYQNFVNFVVRDGRPAPFLYQRSINTAEAYNDYPDDQKTGKSLYEYNSYGPNTVAGTTRAVKVSFDRPFADDGSGDFFRWEVQFVRWVERSGYDVTYSTDVDTHTNGAQLLLHQAFLSVGHSEYWSNEMRNAVQAARDAGVNLAFFGANPIYWQVRFEASAAGVANRVIVCYKDATIDPVQGPTTTVNWRDPPVNRAEQQLVGVMFTNETQGLVNVPYVVTNSSNWVYANTGFNDGDSVPSLVGYEADRVMSNYPAAPANQVLLSRSPFTTMYGTPDVSNSSIYQAPSGAWVFATGTMSWSWALDSYGTSNQPDPRIQHATTNVLNAFLVSRAPVHDLKLVAPASAGAGQPFSATVTAEDARGNPVPSYSGTVHFSSSDTSVGVVLPADSTLTNGQGTFSTTLIRSGPQALTVSDAANNLSTTVSLTVNAGSVVNDLKLTTPATATAGHAFSVTVVAEDSMGNPVTTYNGTVHFSTSDNATGVVLPGATTLANGQGTFFVTLIRSGPQTLTVSDPANNLSSTSNLGVNAAPASGLMLASGTSTTTAGSSVPFTVTAQDSYGNTDPSYAGTIRFTTSDPSPGSMPPNARLTNGRGSVSATLDTAGAQSITATDIANSTLTGRLVLQVRPGAAASVALVVPGTVQVNQSFNVTVTLKDAFGNLATTYTGTIHFSSSDLVAQTAGKLPPDYTFTAADAGTHTFSVTLMTPPSQTISVADTANPSLSTTGRAINVILL